MKEIQNALEKCGNRIKITSGNWVYEGLGTVKDLYITAYFMVKDGQTETELDLNVPLSAITTSEIQRDVKDYLYLEFSELPARTDHPIVSSEELKTILKTYERFHVSSLFGCWKYSGRLDIHPTEEKLYKKLSVYGNDTALSLELVIPFKRILSVCEKENDTYINAYDC